MTVRIRLARGGAKKRPFHKIVAADSRAARDGSYIEQLGHFDPLLPKGHQNKLAVNAERVKYWLSVGAQPTDRIAKLLSEMGLCEKPALPVQTKKLLPKAKAQERIRAAEEAKAKAAEG